MKKRGMNNKGISTLIATVLIILITVVAVAIIWAGIMPVITRTLNIGQACLNARIAIDTESGYSCYNSATNETIIMISHGSEEFELAGVNIILSSKGQSKSYDLEAGKNYTDVLMYKGASEIEMPLKNEEKTYRILMQNDVVEEAKAAPIVKVGNTIKKCSISSSILLPKCNIFGINYTILLPAAPSNLQVTWVSYSIVNLTWQDNSNNENGFYIYLSTNNVSFSYTGTSHANSFSKPGLNPDTEYYFRVNAYNGAGSSETTNIVNATTLLSNLTCSDGTNYSSCSITKPLYCSGGTLINNCTACGCPSGQNCNATSKSCYTPALTFCKYLIPYDRDGGVNPKYLAANATRVELMADFPYDGVGILATAGNDVMNGIALNPVAVSNEFASLRNMPVKPSILKHNLVRVLLKDPGDMFNDTAWQITAQNFAVLGQAIEDLNNSGFGVDGILFDNEGPYSRPTCSTNDTTHGFWNLPVTTSEAAEFMDYPDCWPYIRNWGTYNKAQYETKAKERGNQVMQALINSWPNIKLLFMHSSDVSCNGTEDGTGLGLRQNDVAYANEMLGPYAVGLAEAAYGTNARVIDGGEESYGYITDAKFTLSYNFRNSNGTGDGMTTYMHSSGLACSFIPSADKPIWTNLFDIGFALYNKNSYGGGQTVSTIGTATQLSLIHSDNYVWFYTENNNSIDPLSNNYIGSGWMNQIISGKINANIVC